MTTGMENMSMSCTFSEWCELHGAELEHRFRVTTCMEKLEMSWNKHIRHYAQLLVFVTFG